MITKDERVTFKLSKAMKIELDKFAKATGITRSNLLRQMIDKYMVSNKN